MSRSVVQNIQEKVERYLASRFNLDVWAESIVDQCQQTVFVDLTIMANQILNTYEQYLSKQAMELEKQKTRRGDINKQTVFLQHICRRIEFMLDDGSKVLI